MPECPVCGGAYNATWEFEAGERPNGESFPAGVAYVHAEASPISRADHKQNRTEAYDGDACYAFEDGTTEEDGYPLQPIVPQQ